MGSLSSTRKEAFGSEVERHREKDNEPRLETLATHLLHFIFSAEIEVGVSPPVLQNCSGSMFFPVTEIQV